MARRIHIEETTYEIHAPIQAPALGLLLGETGLDTRRLALSMVIRLALVVFATVLLWRRGDFALTDPVDQLVMVIYGVFVLFPLVHLRDSLKFYQNGIAYNGKPYLFQTNKVTWSKRTGRGYFIAGRALYLEGMAREANVSYIKDARELFDRFYLKGRA